LELFPQASFEYASLLAWLGVVGIVYGALVAFAQRDMKKLIAYSSVSHLGFIVLGIFSMTVEGLQGALIQMVNHGLSTGMLFLCVGVLYERRHTRELAEFGGLVRIMPVFAVFLALAVLSSAGLPGLNGFVGEFLSLLGAARSPFLASFAYAGVGVLGVILAAAYLLKFYHATMFGEVSNPHNYHLRDVSRLEVVQFLPLVVLFFWIGAVSGSVPAHQRACQQSAGCKAGAVALWDDQYRASAAADGAGGTAAEAAGGAVAPTPTAPAGECTAVTVTASGRRGERFWLPAAAASWGVLGSFRWSR
jgi:proton-translocating NADH-quinone oxidoreductase chain M